MNANTPQPQGQASSSVSPVAPTAIAGSVSDHRIGAETLLAEIGRVRMAIVIVGHVDHGKSTVVGRMLADSGSLPDGKLEQIKAYCARNSRPFEYAFLLDALKDEQAQGITIDTARTFFKSSKRDYVIIDAPGHIEFLKNMVSGAARAEAAVLVIDAKEGIQENSKRHGYLMSMLGIRQITVAVNKMDLVNYDRKVFEDIRDEYMAFLSRIGITPRHFVPLAAFHGENMVKASDKMPWYKGPDLLSAIDRFEKAPPKEGQTFRMPLQDVYKFTSSGDDRRIFAGRVESGRVRLGDEVVFQPSGKRSRIKSIEAFNAPAQSEVGAGYTTGFQLDTQIYVNRGEILCRADEVQPHVARRLRANLFWMGKKPFEMGRSYFLKLGTAKIPVRLGKINVVIDASETQGKQEKTQVERHDVADVILELQKPLACDRIELLESTGRFVIVDNYEIAGGGIVREALADVDTVDSGANAETSASASAARDKNLFIHPTQVDRDARVRITAQRGAVLWFTGLSGSGKSTIATALERKLNEAGVLTYLLDGDNIRTGLCSDLGFSSEDRKENIRRISHVSRLFWDANVMTLVSFISPFRIEREEARKLVGGDFIEVFIDSPLDICEGRDPKGLYAKARKGEIPEFTGITSPYEPPVRPDVHVKTGEMDVSACVEAILDHLRDRRYI
jgi:bifunctional enzyme CysN/CysC